uniref:ubiquitinyl hydrolase 1 n=1 Tax=Oryza punctata TaxID=4537 RepID=A0A0E0K0E5_ORYPU
MASTSGTAKDQPLHGRAQRDSTSTAATSTDGSTTAAADGGAVASQPTCPPQPRPGTTRPPLWRPPSWAWPWGSSAAAAAASGGASTAAAAQGGSAASRPPRPPLPPLPPLREPGDGGRGRGTTDAGSSSATAAVDRKGKQKVDEGDRDREQALRKSGPLEEKLLGSSIRAYQSLAAEEPSDAPPATPPAGNIDHEGLSDREAYDAFKDIDLVMLAKQLDTTVKKEEEEKEKEKEKEKEEEEDEDEDDDDEEGELLTHVSKRKNSLRSRILGYISNVDINGKRRAILKMAVLFPCYIVVYKFHAFPISLEQVLDREDTDEEQRLLAALEIEVKPMAMQIVYPEWATAFSWGHEVFKKLIENVIGWKNVASTDRSLAATWMCSHKDEYEQHVPDLGDGYPLEFVSANIWCATNLLPPRRYTDHVPMRALAAAFGVPLRVENLHNGPAHDIYTADGVDVPRVTLLYTGAHYDILYPRHPSGGRSRRRAGWFCGFW